MQDGTRLGREAWHVGWNAVHSASRPVASLPHLLPDGDARRQPVRGLYPFSHSGKTEDDSYQGVPGNEQQREAERADGKAGDVPVRGRRVRVHPEVLGKRQAREEREHVGSRRKLRDGGVRRLLCDGEHDRDNDGADEHDEAQDALHFLVRSPDVHAPQTESHDGSGATPPGGALALVVVVYVPDHDHDDREGDADPHAGPVKRGDRYGGRVHGLLHG